MLFLNQSYSFSNSINKNQPALSPPKSSDRNLFEEMDKVMIFSGVGKPAGTADRSCPNGNSERSHLTFWVNEKL